MPSYFTGKRVDDPELVQSPATKFHDFIQQFINLPVPLSVTSVEYQAMTKAERSKAKQVGYAVPCTFSKSPWHGRKLEHAQPCDLLILDIDDENVEAAKNFVSSPELLIGLLKRFNFAAYKTISSTPEAPRLRIMVDAASIPVDQYPDAVLTVAKILGLDKVTRESAIATQPMFRPSVFADQDPELDHPLIATHNDGRPFRVDDIVTEDLPGLVSGNKPARAASTGSLDDFLVFFQFPVEGVTLEAVKEALTFIDADCTRPQWLEIAAALKHQFASTADDKAYVLFDEWSATGSKYEGGKDTSTIWRSFKEQARGRAPVTIRSLLKRAVEGGWNSDPVKESGYKAVSDWIQYQAKSAMQLMSEGAKRIAAAPLLSQVEEGCLVQTLVQKSKQDFHHPLSAMDLKREIKRHKNSIQAKKQESNEIVFPPWTLGIVYIAATNSFLRHRTRQHYSREAFDAMFSRKLLPTVEELEKADKEINETTLNTPKFKPGDYLLQHLKCQTVDDVTYNPAEPEEIIIREDGKNYVNMYRRSYREADKALASYASDLLDEHLYNTIIEPEYRTIYLDWMAHNVQFPGVKIRWVILEQGGEGSGKTMKFQIMRAVLGNDNVKLINPDSIKKGWNEWVFGSQLVGIEELRVAGQNRHEIMNTLKEPITNDYVPVNQRARDTRDVRNVTNYIAFTNFHDAVVVGDDSRRWCIIKSRLQHKEQIRELVARDPEYFSRLGDSFTTHAAGYRYVLENRTISSSFKPNGPAPTTKYLQEMIADTSDDLTVVLKDIIEKGESPLIGSDVLAFGVLKNAMESEGIHNISQKHLTHILRNAGYAPVGKHTIIGSRQSVWAREDRTHGEDPVRMLLQRAENSSNIEA